MFADSLLVNHGLMISNPGFILESFVTEQYPLKHKTFIFYLFIYLFYKIYVAIKIIN